MKHLRLVPAIVLVIALAAFVLAGCGGTETETTTTAATPATTAGTATTAASSGTTATTAVSTEEPITLVFSFHEPDTVDLSTKVLQPWFQRIEEATGGRVKIEAHYNGELAGPDTAYDEVLKGNVDIAFIMTTLVPKLIGDNIIDASFVGNNTYRMTRAYNELYQKYPEMQEAYSDVKPLLLFSMFPVYCGTNKPIETVADFKGLKLIASDSYQAARVEALGGASVSVVPPDVYPTLEKGIADGGTIPGLPQLISNSWGEVIDYMTLIVCKHPSNAVVMNLDTWNSLPADIQQVFEDQMSQMIDVIDQVMYQLNLEAMTAVPEKYGTKITEPSEQLLADIEKLWTPVRDDWLDAYEADGFPAHDLYNDMVTLSQKYSAEEYNLNK